MRKSYEVKTYSVSGAYKATLKSTQRITDIRFSSPINSGQGECEILLDAPFGDTSTANGDFVRAYVFDDLHPNGKIVFTGQVNRVDRVYAYGQETVRLRCLGFGALLGFLLFKSGGSYAFTKNQSCGQTVKDVADYFNSVYSGSWISYAGTDIESGPTANVSFDYSKCSDAIKKCAGVAGFDWRIDADGSVHFFSKPSVPVHKPKLQGGIQTLTLNEDAERVVNRYFLSWASGTVTAQDAASQSAYGVRELKESDSSILDATTAQAKADAYVAANKDPKRKAAIALNDSYRFDSDTKSIEDVSVGETVSVLNTDYGMANLQIRRAEYTPEELRLDLEGYDSFGQEVIS